MAEICLLCKQPGTKKNPLNNHHVKGRRNDSKDVMRVHSSGCHAFADWITQEFNLRGNIDILTANIIVYFYNRVTFFYRDNTFERKP